MDDITSDRMPTSTVAFASYVDNNYLAGFEVLVKSLMLNNPWVDQDFLILYDDLTSESIARIAALYPKFVFRKVDGSRYSAYAKGDQTNYLVEKAYYILDAFRVRDYDRLVTLDVDMVVLGDIRHLVDTDAAFGAVPQHFDSRGNWRINSGVMTFDRRVMNDDFVARMDAIGNAGAYDLERHDQGILSAVLDGDYHRLSSEYNLVKRAVKHGTHPPEGTRILHFTGSTKPWTGGEVGYALAEQHWHDYDLPAVAFWREYVARHGGGEIGDFYAQCAARFESLSDEDLRDPRKAAGNYHALGAFEQAELALKLHLLEKTTPSPSSWLAYGINQKSRSQRGNAEVALTLATAQHSIGPKAHAQLAELYWTYREYDAAESSAMDALTLDPTQRKARLLLSRISRSRRVDGAPDKGVGPAIGHVAFYVDDEGNFGDVMLPIAVRTSVETTVPDARWASIHAHQVFDAERARWANKNLDAIVIGGGGLFLPDTAPNGESGWQWNVTDEALDALAIPIIVYTVGFNLFPGQQFYGDRFSTSVTKLIHKAAFVGLRNHGSVDAVRGIVGEALAAKVEFLPCVTTVHGLQAEVESHSSDAPLPIVYLNVAFDRAGLRFGDGYQDFVTQLGEFVTSLKGKADVRCLSHAKTDEKIVFDLRRQCEVRVPVEPIYNLAVPDALAKLSAAAVVVGMRGHASMIPFGLGTPIISVISHAKLRYFLEDIGHQEWGVDVASPDFGSQLTSVVNGILGDPDRYHAEVTAAREELAVIVDSANSRVAQIVNSGTTRG